MLSLAAVLLAQKISFLEAETPTYIVTDRYEGRAASKTAWIFLKTNAVFFFLQLFHCIGFHCYPRGFGLIRRLFRLL
jgi:hypothetical protein